jgi:hypothetical protein
MFPGKSIFFGGEELFHGWVVLGPRTVGTKGADKSGGKNAAND